MTSTSTNSLQVAGACAGNALALDAAALGALPAEHQVPDISALAPGRTGRAVWLRGIAALAQPTPEAAFVHVESLDGGFTANVPLQRALDEGLVLYALDGAPLPAKFGGPFRLLFVGADGEGEDCSLNVKFLGSVSFVAAPGSHTASCADEA